jgi:hypothetical protein
VFEGTVEGNMDSLQAMSLTSRNPNAHFLAVRGASHFSILAPTNRLIAAKILRDEGPECKLTFTVDELSEPFAR